jgi:Cu(I)/Ag(I) efflux system membrane fusion protein
MGLAGDEVGRYNQAIPGLAPALDAVGAAFPEGHEWSSRIASVRNSGQLTPAGDLAAAREAFLPFSTQMVDLARVVRAQAPGAARFVIYRCPMAPKPGVWIQSKGPLRNPYYGSEMLECGLEVK